MGFQKGQTGNAGGRVDPRKARAREAIARIVEDSADKIGGWIEAIESDEGPGAALRAFTALAEYAIPKLARTEMVGEVDVRRLTDDELEAHLVKAAAALGYVKVETGNAQ